MRRATLALVALLLAAMASGQIPADKRSAALAKESVLLHGKGPVSRPKQGVQCVVAGQIAYGQTVAGSLSATDCFLSDNNQSYVDYWQFQGTAGDIVTIDYASDAFDTYLALLDGAGNVVAQNDDFGGFNSHIAFTLTSTGTWVIGATSTLLQVTGDYTIHLQGQTAPPPQDTALFLNGSRFKVEVSWATTDGRSGSGNAIALTDDTGYFWFFDSANVELVVKVLDGRGVNGHFWVFYGALSDVQYSITVTDTTNQAPRVYANPQNNLASVADTKAF